MRIAHYLIGSEIAGGELVAAELAQAAVAAGHSVIVVVPRDGPIVDLLAHNGIATRILAGGRAYNLRHVWRLWRLLRREHVDLLHTHALFTGNLTTRVTGRLAGIPIVAHAHITDHYATRSSVRAVQRRLDALSARLCARVVAVSAALRQTLVDTGYPTWNLVTIPNGVRLDERPIGDREQLRLSLGAVPGGPLVGAVGRLCLVKGQLELIHAVVEIRERHPGLRVLLIGRDIEHGGAYETQLRSEAATKGASETILFAGYRDDIPAVLNVLDVFVLPSHDEGMPLVLLEAMAQRKPIVATRVGGVPEAIENGVNGLLVESRDSTALAQALDVLLSDPARAADLGEHAFATFDRSYRSERMAALVLALYDDILAETSP